MTILNKFSKSYISKLNQLNKRYIFIRDLIDRDMFMTNEQMTFYVSLIMKDLLYRDTIYSILFKVIPCYDICELVLKYTGYLSISDTITYNVHPVIL